MYVAMNRFKVVSDREVEFEGVWKERARAIDDVPGFLELKILRPETGTKEYISMSLWESKDAFVGWTKSDAFARAHSKSRSGLLEGHPNFEGFEVFETSD